MLILLLACAAPETGPLETDAGAYTVTLATNPDPLMAGEATLLVEAAGADRLALDGEMVGMGHGFGTDPVITGEDGSFEAVVDFSMSGTWALTFTIEGEAGTDTLTTDVDVR